MKTFFKNAFSPAKTEKTVLNQIEPLHYGHQQILHSSSCLSRENIL